jgi:hypothetical protein
MTWFLWLYLLLTHAAVFFVGFWFGLTRRNGGPPSEGGGEVVRMNRAAL